jgi:hypothetical protein
LLPAISASPPVPNRRVAIEGSGSARRLTRQKSPSWWKRLLAHRPDPHHQPASKLEAAYHRADNAIQQIVDLLAA